MWTPPWSKVHTEKESPAAHFKGGFGFHPVLAFPDNTNEAPAGILRPGSSGANTTADHIDVTDLALAQIPDSHRHGSPILVRADGAGCTKAWLARLRALRDNGGLNVSFSVGFTMTEQVQAAILDPLEAAWTPAVDADGSPREGADVAELTGMLPNPAAAGWPDQAAGHRAPRTTPPRCATHLHRHRRLAVPGPRHRHRRRAARPVRAEDAALPAAARRRPHHPRPTPPVRAHRRALALAARAGRRVRQTRRPPATATHLTSRSTHRPSRQEQPAPAGRPYRRGTNQTPAANSTNKISNNGGAATERPGLAPMPFS